MWRKRLRTLRPSSRPDARRRAHLSNDRLERIDTLDPRLNSFVVARRAGALAAAEESDARRARGEPRSSIDGVPISMKDNIHVAGMPATWGSRALADFSPAMDELPVARLRAAGAIMLGKTNVPELTLEGLHAQRPVRRHAQPLERRADAGRLERGSGGGRRGGSRSGGHRHRWRRVDPPARLSHRPRRLQAIDRTHGRASTDFPQSSPISRPPGRSPARSPTRSCSTPSWRALIRAIRVRFAPPRRRGRSGGFAFSIIPRFGSRRSTRKSPKASRDFAQGLSARAMR